MKKFAACLITVAAIAFICMTANAFFIGPGNPDFQFHGPPTGGSGAGGEVLYVRHGLATGNNDGSSYEDAFQGVDEIVWDVDAGDDTGEVGEGDTLYVCGGPYDDRLLVGASGTVDNHIVLDGECSAVDAGYTDGEFGRIALENVTEPNGQVISLYNDSYIIIQNLTFTDIFGVAGRRIVSQKVQADGTHTGGTNATVMTNSAKSYDVDSLIGGIIFNTTAGSESRGIITDNDATTITVAELVGGDAQWENGDTYAILDDDGAIKIYGTTDHIIIRGNDFTLDATGTGFAIYAGLYRDMIVHDIQIIDNSFTGDNEDSIYFAQLATVAETIGQAYNITVRDNITTGSYRFFSTGAITNEETLDPDEDPTNDNDFSFHNVDIIDNVIEIADGGKQAINLVAGVKPVDGLDYNEISGNTITTLGTQGTFTNILQLHFVRDMVIENNSIEGPHLTSNCDGCAIIIDWMWGEPDYTDYISRDVIIRNNIIYNGTSTGCDGKGISVYRGTDVEIYNNIVYDSDIGIRVASGDTYITENISIFNNTIYNTAVTGISINSDVENVEIKNNIISTSAGDGIDDNSGNVGDEDEQYNLIYDSVSNNCEGTFGSRTNNTCGSNDVEDEDPLFVSVTTDFSLYTGSPAIDAGTSLISLFTTDIDGTTRPVNSVWDMGAYEGVGTEQPTDDALLLETGGTDFLLLETGGSDTLLLE